jgi:hypothetical protein
MIEKPTILITSLGRTGTEFFARLFAEILPDSTSIHEPDIFQNTGVGNKWGHYFQQVRRAGIWRMVILKALGKWTLVKLSDAKFLGHLDPRQAIDGLSAQRRSFIHHAPGSIYVEANIGYYGLLDITPQVFREHRAVYIVRDGRDWIRSHMNWGEFYGKRGVRKLISHNWPAASDLPLDPFAGKWKKLSRFEQLCWAWGRLNEYALDMLSKNPHARVFHFEKIFSGEGRYQILDELVSFTASLHSIDIKRIGSTKDRLEHRTHQSSEGFPIWEKWTKDQQSTFYEICGFLMEKLGYKIC